MDLQLTLVSALQIFHEPHWEPTMQLQSMIEEFWFLCYIPAKYLRALIPNCNLPSSVEKGKKKSFHLQFLWDRMKGAVTRYGDT